MHLRQYFIIAMLLICASPLAAQTVLFDGITSGERTATALLTPVIVSGDDYRFSGRLNYGILEKLDLFGIAGAQFNGGADAFGGFGWSANIFEQTDSRVVNFGVFNSYVFPTGGPDALVTVAPIFSHSFDRDQGGRVTPYAGLSATFLINAPGNIYNAVIGVKVTDLSDRWDLVSEIQPGEKTQFAAGFVFRF